GGGGVVGGARGDGTVRVWEAGSSRERHRFKRESPPVALALSADGTRVAAADEDEVVVVWDTQTGKEVRTLPSYGRVDALAWSPNGHLAAGYNNWAIRVWDVSSGRQRGPVLMHQYPVTSLAWSADGQYLASGSNDRTARLWEPESGHELALLRHDDNVSGVTWSRVDARLLATSGVEGQVRVWNMMPSDGSRRLVHDASIGKVTATADGRIVATSGGEDERIIRMWDATTGQQLFRVTHGDRVQALDPAADGRMRAAGTKNGDVLVIDATGRERARLTHGGPVLALAWSADSQRLASAGEDGRPIVLWDVGSRRVLNRLAPAGKRVSALA